MYIVNICFKLKFMNSKTTLSISEARKKIFQLADEVQKPGVHYTLTENGRPKAVLMSVEEFESWAETLEVIKEFPDLENDINEAEKDYKNGNYVTLDEILVKEGYVLADKSKKKYEISTSRAKKSAKRNRKNR